MTDTERTERASGRTRRSGPTYVQSGAIYTLGMLGAWVWFWQQSDGFWGHLWALVEGVFWPAFMVYQGFSALY
ncbi:hypothetical protein GCM10022242_28800 [Nocardioides panacisoli]|uniref:Uncharacterized protein n=1 Tax=Nocardioides panacisoli TaxID=627624 RepID=A0ABP7ISS6_9ACTN